MCGDFTSLSNSKFQHSILVLGYLGLIDVTDNFEAYALFYGNASHLIAILFHVYFGRNFYIWFQSYENIFK